ncbi:MAG TPA: hypothetical protein VF889_01180 [Bacteroidota bacterium]
MLLSFSILFYLVGLLVVIKVLRGLHQKDELMDRIYSSWSLYQSGEEGSPTGVSESDKEEAVQAL